MARMHENSLPLTVVQVIITKKSHKTPAFLNIIVAVGSGFPIVKPKRIATFD